MSHRNTSRFPSAYGHTPSYRSYNSIDSSVPYTSSSTRTSTLGLGLGDIGSKSVFGHGGILDDLSLGSHHGLGDLGTSKSSSSAKVQSYTSSYSSSSHDGARPKVEYSTDSTYKSSATGASGIPHTSYSHAASSFSTENPYKNRVSHYSYNI